MEISESNVFAILNFRADRIISDLISSLAKFGQVTVFVPETEVENPSMLKYKTDFNVCIVGLDPASNRSKARNDILRHFKSQNETRFLHVLEDTTSILADPTSFISDITEMMDVLDNNVWFNTICDSCNYIFQKYVPRSNVKCDLSEYKDVYDKTIHMCSNANTQWTIYNMSNYNDEEYLLDEDFDVPMFFIVEYMARRRNLFPSKYMMNLYPTVESEKNVFKTIKDPEEKANYNVKSESEIFNSKKIDHHPDSLIEPFLDRFLERLKFLKESGYRSRKSSEMSDSKPENPQKVVEIL